MNMLPTTLSRRHFHQLIWGSLALGGLQAMSGEPIYGESDVKPASPPLTTNGSFKAASNQFAIQFLKSVIDSQPSKNQFLSPFSIESALLMTMEGARGQTAAEMGQALGFPQSVKADDPKAPWQLASVRSDLKSIVQSFYRGDSAAEVEVRKTLKQKRSELDKANARAVALSQKGNFNDAVKESNGARQLADQINELSKTVDKYELRNANGLWIDKSFVLKPEYQNLIRQSYSAALENVDFASNPAAQGEKINRWISDNTQQKINNIIPPGTITKITRLVLANAIYFRGTWQDPFDPGQTKPGRFQNIGNQQVEVPMMSKFCKSGRYAAFQSDGAPFETPRTLEVGSDPKAGYPKDGFQVMELGYNGGDLQMWIALPQAKSGLKAMIESLDGSKLDNWDSALQHRDVTLVMPKFKLEATYDLQENLEQLGMKSAFDPNQADFSGMSQETVFISKVLHKSFVDVNEKGTEAAAATVVMMAPSAMAQVPFIPSFVADHPFLFMIRHRPSGTILFAGLVQQL
ncbi:MAG: serpin family protein [Pirellulales bacterium]